MNSSAIMVYILRQVGMLSPDRYFYSSDEVIMDVVKALESLFYQWFAGQVSTPFAGWPYRRTQSQYPAVAILTLSGGLK